MTRRAGPAEDEYGQIAQAARPTVTAPPPMPDDSAPTGEITQYRSAVRDALRRPIPDEGELRVWLDDDLDDRAAPAGWVHLISSREVAFLLLTMRVVEFSLDHDLSDPERMRFGAGAEVVDFLEDAYGRTGTFLWPRDGITVHSANAAGRERMAAAIRAAGRRAGLEVEETRTPGSKPRFLVSAPA